MQCLKNITLYAIAGLMFWITGYNLMYTGVDGGFMGSFGPYAFDAVGGDALDTGYSTASDWFFQMVFCATTASIVSGTLAERIKLWPFCFHGCPDGHHLPDHRFLGMGRRLAQRRSREGYRRR